MLACLDLLVLELFPSLVDIAVLGSDSVSIVELFVGNAEFIPPAIGVTVVVIILSSTPFAPALFLCLPFDSSGANANVPR